MLQLFVYIFSLPYLANMHFWDRNEMASLLFCARETSRSKYLGT